MNKYGLTQDEIHDMMNEVMSINHDTPDDEKPLRIDENDSDNYRKVNILKWTHDKESIKIDEHGDIHCDAWGNYYIKGKDTIVETIELMNRYINECKKDKALRNFSFIELVTK